MKVALVGATGLVGRVMCQVLEEREFPVSKFYPVASDHSVGKTIRFQGREHVLVSKEEAVAAKPDVALFSAGASVSREWAPKFAAVGTYVIDNSSAWRMDPEIPLIVPECNQDVLTGGERIIANPNCSTIQMVVALKPLYETFGIERLVISTYQSITGTGAKAVRQYEAELAGKTPEAPAYAHQIFQNCLPHCDVFLENDYTKEEMKLVHETRKILGDPSMRITATAVRVPVFGGHSESVNVELRKPATLEKIRSLLSAAPGVILQDDPSGNAYPMPLHAHHQDEVFVGRLRIDESNPNTFNLWIVADNLRKGAATNAVQIAECLLNQEILHSGKVFK
ncbi:MAG: aspartate-semialdehyde dehydrogenase [Saprospiraceae bacterium]